MQNQQSFAELLPADQLEVRIKSNSWNIRKQVYEQILYLLKQLEAESEEEEQDQNMQKNIGNAQNKRKKNNSHANSKKKALLLICGKQYTVKKLIPYFQDIVDQEHPGVLIPALCCVQEMIQKRLCSGREFVKLIDQGFDKFPLKINKGKEIMQKFADIIQRIDLQYQFVLKKLNNSAHEKSMIFALEVVSMLGMTQLISKVRDISQKHAKSAVRQVASQIQRQLEQLNQQYQQSMIQETKKSQNSKYPGTTQIENMQMQNISKQIVKQKPRSKTPTKSNTVQQTFNFNRSQLQILEKVPQYEQLQSKLQQKFSQSLTELFEKYFKMVKQGKTVPQLPMNQLTNISYIIRIMIQSNNAVTSTNGLKLLHLLSAENSQLLPRSFPLLFIFQKFRLHATHSINTLLYELCDSFLLINAISTNRNVDLVQAVSEGAANKKANVRYGCFMVFNRIVGILYGKWSIVVENESDQVPQQILLKMNEGDCEKIKSKLYKLLVKCYDNFSSKMSDDKKYQEKLQDIKIIMSLAYGSGTSTTQSAVSSIQNLKNKTLKKTLSQAGTKTQTADINKPIKTQIDEQPIKSKPTTSSSSRQQQNSNYKIVNPEQKSTKILTFCQNPTPNAITAIKKLVLESLLQYQQCIEQNRFQLFYYSEVIENFMNLYEPNDKTCDIVSEYLIQLLLRISKIKHTNNSKISANSKILVEGLRNIIKICICELVLGEDKLVEVLDNLLCSTGAQIFLQALILLDEAKKSNKLKKKNKKVFLRWLDSSVPAQNLSDRLFEIMQKIEKGEPLGKAAQPVSIKEEDRNRGTFGKKGDQRQQKQRQTKDDGRVSPKMQKKITFNRQLNYEKEMNSEQLEQHRNNKEQGKRQKNGKQMRKNENRYNNYLQHRQQLQIIQKQILDRQKKETKKPTLPPQAISNSSMQTIQKSDQMTKNQRQYTRYSNPLTQTNSMTSPNPVLPNILDHSQISQISYKDDQSMAASGSGYACSTDRDLDIGLQSKQKTAKQDLEDNSQYEQYYKQYKKEKLKEYQTQNDDIPNFGTSKRTQINNMNLYELSESKSGAQQQQNGEQHEHQVSNDSVKIEDYKQYIKKIRQTYLPEEYLKQQNEQVKQSQQKDKMKVENQQVQNKTQLRTNIKANDSHQIEQESKARVSKNIKNLQIAINSDSDSDKEQEQAQIQLEKPEFQYKIINANKLNFMLQNAANPYSHLRNQIILPFRKNNQQEYFIQQLSLYLTSLPQIKLPQPFNSLLLCVILLFSQIQSNRALITPLQQLYEHLASLVSTNQFLKIIISLFHSVIEETVPQLRTFLITILTKSVTRLMPFCEDSVQLLRDLSQFYNVGENVYFQMYEQEYRQICTAIEGEVLFEVVEKALLQEGENLGVIVESWFETRIKNKIKGHIKQIIEENEEEGIQDEHRFIEEQF